MCGTVMSGKVNEVARGQWRGQRAPDERRGRWRMTRSLISIERSERRKVGDGKGYCGSSGGEAGRQGRVTSGGGRGGGGGRAPGRAEEGRKYLKWLHSPPSQTGRTYSREEEGQCIITLLQRPRLINSPVWSLSCVSQCQCRELVNIDWRVSVSVSEIYHLTKLRRSDENKSWSELLLLSEYL